MKIKNANLRWYAFIYDSNNHELRFINVLLNMEEEIAKKVRKGKKDSWRPVYDYKTFKDFIKTKLMARYWSRSEYETVIGDLFHYSIDDLEKHDVWWQLEPNLDRICEYIISTMDIKFI